MPNTQPVNTKNQCLHAAHQHTYYNQPEKYAGPVRTYYAPIHPERQNPNPILTSGTPDVPALENIHTD